MQVHKLARTDGASAAAIARRFGTTSDAIQAILLDHPAPADPAAARRRRARYAISREQLRGLHHDQGLSFTESGSSPATAQPLSGTSPALLHPDGRIARVSEITGRLPLSGEEAECGQARRHWQPGGVIRSAAAGTGLFSPWGTTQPASAVSASGKTSPPWPRAMSIPRTTRESPTPSGFRSDGTVLATGWNGDGQCDVAAWRDVTAVAAGWRRTLGLLANGTVLAAGRGSEGQCDMRSWREMVALSCGDWHSAGVRADGRALAAGNNRRGQCAVDGWRGLTAVAAGYLHTVALRGNGRVLAAGDGTTGACDVDAWEDAVALAAGSYHTVAVTASGRVLAAGDNSHGQCDVGGWRDIVAVAAGSTHTLGLRSDGTIVSAGSNASGQCDVGSWSGIRVPGARA